MIQEHLHTLAFNCGGKAHTEGPMRAVTGVTLTWAQLTKFAEAIKSGQHTCSSLCHPEEPCMLTATGTCPNGDVR